jgi:hypothetical protein
LLGEPWRGSHDKIATLFFQPVEEIAYNDIFTLNGRLIVISAYNDLVNSSRKFTT